MTEPIPDGLAYGKVKEYQVNGREPNEPPIIFNYYTEYGDDGIVKIIIEGRSTFVPIYALMSFVDLFRKELSGTKV